MRNVTKIALASLALLGTVATVAPAANAQAYNGPTPGYCGPMTSNITNWIIDPATGQAITEQQYLSRYPSNPANWTYNCSTGLWTDNGYGYAPSYQGPAYYSQGPAYYGRGRGYNRESRNYGHDRGARNENHGHQAQNNGHDRGNDHKHG